jgi:hypothetical protein
MGFEIVVGDAWPAVDAQRKWRVIANHSLAGVATYVTVQLEIVTEIG